MRIVLITPARPASRSGNRITGVRWAGILRRLGHRVSLLSDYDGQPADAMVALHAWRSAASIQRFHDLHPQRPLIVALAGTDAYHYIEHDPEPTLRSLVLADRLVGLHEQIGRRLPRRFHGKLRIIHQSAAPLSARSRAASRSFDVAVVGSLREVTDPLRAAEAARRLPPEARLRIIHVGAAETAHWAARAKAEMQANRRYVWRGEVSGAAVRRLLGRARALVLSSINEGGANVIGEAVMAWVPVLVSRIDAAVAQLGRDYPGYFAVGDTDALARLLHRIESEPRFLAGLRAAIRRRAPLFQPARELRAWRSLLAELDAASMGRQRGAA